MSMHPATTPTNGNDIIHGHGDDYGPNPIPPSLVHGIMNPGDTLHGLDGNDIIFGDFFNPLVNYQSDSLFGDAGNDWLFGDTVDFSYAPLKAAFPGLADVFIDLEDGTHLDVTKDPAFLTRSDIGQADDLHGGTGDDHLYGGAGSDILRGNAGNDYLDGGTRDDDMQGGMGNDTYVVDNGNDIINEKFDSDGGLGGGIDLVLSSISYSLNHSSPIDDTVENMTLTGAGNTSATGNAIANRLAGNGGANTLSGLAGNDVLSGAAGADTLVGGAGNDSLAGGLGNDFFVFNTALSSTLNRDTITDFHHLGDKIKLENAVFTAVGGVGALNGNFFRVGTHALDPNDFIIYNSSTHVLSYDSDGSGAHAAVQFAVLASPFTAISAADFLVI